MLDRLRELSYRIERNRRAISRALLIFLLAMLQIGGGAWLYNADVTRGTPLMIERYGVPITLFAAFMLWMGVLTFVLMLYRVALLNAVRLCALTSPFIVYIMFTAWGATHGSQSGQGFYFYAIFYLIAMTAIWGTD